MAKYYIVAYRSDYRDYCMGCYMGSTCSELELRECDTEDDLVSILGYYLSLHDTTQRSPDYASWELHYYTIGREGDIIHRSEDCRTFDDDDDEPIWERARKYASSLTEEHNRKRNRKMKEEGEKQRQLMEDKERQQYRKLKEKYGN